MRQRTIVCPIIQNDGAYLLCKMADDRGVFPGQWALSGGGVEPGERIEEALRREIREELGDVAFLLLFVARMYEKQGKFTLNDALNNNRAKMIRRHPHVFSKTQREGEAGGTTANDKNITAVFNVLFHKYHWLGWERLMLAQFADSMQPGSRFFA